MDIQPLNTRQYRIGAKDAQELALLGGSLALANVLLTTAWARSALLATGTMIALKAGRESKAFGQRVRNPRFDSTANLVVTGLFVTNLLIAHTAVDCLRLIRHGFSKGVVTTLALDVCWHTGVEWISKRQKRRWRRGEIDARTARQLHNEIRQSAQEMAGRARWNPLFRSATVNEGSLPDFVIRETLRHCPPAKLRELASINKRWMVICTDLMIQCLRERHPLIDPHTGETWEQLATWRRFPGLPQGRIDRHTLWQFHLPAMRISYTRRLYTPPLSAEPVAAYLVGCNPVSMQRSAAERWASLEATDAVISWDPSIHRLFDFPHCRPDRLQWCIRRAVFWGASPDTRDAKGNLPLHRAVGFDTTIAATVIELTRDKNGVSRQINEKNSLGQTPLHKLIGRYGHCLNGANTLATMKLLIAEGADPNLKDGEGHTALYYAKRWTRKSAVAYQIIAHLKSTNPSRASLALTRLKGQMSLTTERGGDIW